MPLLPLKFSCIHALHIGFLEHIAPYRFEECSFLFFNFFVAIIFFRLTFPGPWNPLIASFCVQQIRDRYLVIRITLRASLGPPSPVYRRNHVRHHTSINSHPSSDAGLTFTAMKCSSSSQQHGFQIPGRYLCHLQSLPRRQRN